MHHTNNNGSATEHKREKLTLQAQTAAQNDSLMQGSQETRIAA
jgi:hypothetical protein